MLPICSTARRATAAVNYTYQMGKYDVTIGQYCQFLNAVAGSDPYGLYANEVMQPGYYANWGIYRSVNGSNYVYSVPSGYANYPIYDITWGDAARFCNWLQNGQPTGPEGPGTTETGAYTLDGALTDSDLMLVTRNVGATYFLPTEDEWYKAAYYKGGGTNAGYWDYTTRSNTAPSHVLSATGTNNANYYNGYTDRTTFTTPVGEFARCLAHTVHLIREAMSGSG